ncbi:MAG: histidine phosphatase family protein [Bacteroidota bacterium]
MKMLFLLRHAKASKEDPTLPDILRPLTDRGFSDAKLVSEKLKLNNMVPQKIISSNAVRAYTTAGIFAETFKIPGSEVERLSALYECNEEDYLDAIYGIDDAVSSCMITGHNNTISFLAQRLLQKNIEAMKTCGLLIIASETTEWKSFDSFPCSLQLDLYPSLLK